MLASQPYLISARWPAPAGVEVHHSVRWGGVSHPPFGTWNLGDHVSDNEKCVLMNRQLLAKRLCLVGPVQWLQQTHSTQIVCTDPSGAVPEADGVLLEQPGQSAVVLTADCLPVVLCREDGSAATVIHAGWRGLAAGILQEAHGLLRAKQLMAWIGPCILPTRFEVGGEVRERFLATVPKAESAFLPQANGRWQGMLARLAYLILRQLGLSRIYGFGITEPWPVSGADMFFSYRHAAMTGRFATVLSLL